PGLHRHARDVHRDLLRERAHHRRRDAPPVRRHQEHGQRPPRGLRPGPVRLLRVEGHLHRLQRRAAEGPDRHRGLAAYNPRTMLIGSVREIKDNEYRVGLVPGGVKALVDNRHQVLVQSGAGLGSGIPDDEFKAAGAEIVGTAAEVWRRADILVKVKEPLESEYPVMREGQVLFTYLHLAPLPGLTQALLDRKVTGVAYETITRAAGSL